MINSEPLSLYTGNPLDDWGEMQNIQVITLRQHLEDLAAEDAWNQTSDITQIDRTIDKLRKLKHNHAKEFIQLDDGKLTIGVNADEIDEESINYALSLLYDLDELRERRRIEFGEDIQIDEVANEE